MYQSGQYVLFKTERCACQGGGFTQMEGTIVGIVTAPNGLWYQINTHSGVVTVKEQWIESIQG